jgi:hypothetical protein
MDGLDCQDHQLWVVYLGFAPSGIQYTSSLGTISINQLQFSLASAQMSVERFERGTRILHFYWLKIEQNLYQFQKGFALHGCAEARDYCMGDLYVSFLHCIRTFPLPVQYTHSDLRTAYIIRRLRQLETHSILLVSSSSFY